MGASHPKHMTNSVDGDPSGRSTHHSSHPGAAYAEEQHDGIEVDIPFDASIECMQLNEFPVVMKWQGLSAKRVFVSGSWDDWKSKIPLSRSHDDFATIVNLQQGYHTYAFEVDGEWKCDESVPKVVNSGFGDRVTNVLEIDRADYEVFSALDKDLPNSESGMLGIQKPKGPCTKCPLKCNCITAIGADAAEYTQDIPDRQVLTEALMHHQLVTIPPHLLQIMLNKSMPVNADPNQLPTPANAALNHLYALSIKDGVMVLSATHRYRRKFVTTVFYKPVD